MRPDNRDLVIRAALSILPAHLEPYVRSTVRGLAPQEQRRLIEAVHITSPHVDIGDVTTQIRILTARDDDGHYLLPLPPGLGSGLQEVRRLHDAAAHGRSFDPEAALAALVAVGEVLRRIGADDGVAELRTLIAAIDDGQQGPGPDPASAPETRAQAGPGAGSGSSPIIIARAETAPVISYAHAVARLVPRVRLRLTLHSLLDEDPEPQGAAPTITVSIIEEGEGNEVAGPTGLDPAPQWQWEDGSQELSATIDLPLQRDRLLHISQPCPSHIRVELRLPDGATQVRTLPGPTVLPVRQWTLAGPAQWSGASLATFVQPAQPALAALEAAARRQDRPEAPEAGAWGPAPADALVGAACAALRIQGLGIHAPEGPWAGAPQSIRSAEALMDTRRGTTLDLAIALAGLLERLEIPALLLLTPGCALVGYWRGGPAPEAPPQDPEAIADLVAQDLLGIVDPGLVMSSERPVLHLLPEAARLQTASALGDAALVLWLGQARAQGAAPQPLLERDADGVVHETGPEALAGPLAPAAEAPPAAQPPAAQAGGADQEVPALVREWKQRLLDLTAHNPLIDRSRQQAIPLALPPGLISGIERMVLAKDLVVLRPDAGREAGGEDPQERAARLLAQERAVEVDLSAEDYGSRLRALATKARVIVEDTGANNLYLAFGTMEWQIGGRRALSPLVLIPVTLHPSGEHYGLVLDEAGESTPNHSFLARFAADTGIDLSEPVERLRPEREEDFLAALEEIRQRLSQAGRPEEVSPTVHLGLFQFSTYRMWKDLEDSWRPIADNPLVRYLIETPDPAGRPFIDPVQPDGAEDPEGPEPAGIDEVVENLPLTADATQARVVADAVAGRSLVVEGPPGTGKSQTVANLIFRALATGRTVMFVAGKQTALDVVARRLRSEAGIGDLLLNLHDNGMKPAQMSQSLRRALELRTESIDLGDLEERRRTVRELRARLEDYRRGLHGPADSGRSRYEDYEAAVTAGEPGEPGEPFDAARHDQLVEDYRRAVARLRQLLPAELLCAVLSHRDQVLTRDTERTLALHREISRRKGSMSIRQMLTSYPDLITAITPCILVSPDSVARFFPAGRRYVDIVIFDEASQIPVPDAVGAIGRGRSVVIAGDPKQMPPTSIAASLGVQAVTHDDLVGVETQEEASILTQCLSARMCHYRLPWHYRSRVESLITFSNQRYYDGALRSFPSPLAMAAGPDDSPGGHGIILRRVQGHYFRPADAQGRGKARPRTNPHEAEQVVAEVLRHFEASPHATPSLGVITFNDKQRDLIEELLRDTGSPRIQAALEEDDGLLIKNLENVQGEERDTILFSVTFSPNSRGDLPLTFGPLSCEGGQRRLNVAITRARRQIIVFSSFDPEQLRADRSSHQGVKDLRDYLEQAREAGAPAALAPAGPAPDWYRHAIAEQLRAAGLDVREAVGQSSFTVDLVLAPAGRPEEPRVAVMLDGRQWNRRETAADRDIMPADVLGAMGWPRVERVWAPQWAADKEAVITRLVEACGLSRAEAAQEAPAQGAATGQGTPDGTAPGAPGRQAIPEYREWVPDQVRPQSVLDEAEADSASRNEVRRLARRICEVEAPLSRHRLVVQVCRAFGLSQVPASREDSVRRILGEAFAHIDEHDFVWLRRDQVHTAPPYRRRAMDYVGIEEIHPRELAGAIEAVRVSSSAWTSREDLFRQVLTHLSTTQHRLTPRVWEALNRALALADDAGGSQEAL